MASSGKSQPRTVVLLSGGVDSTTYLAIARGAWFAPYALSFRYGRRHGIELEAADALGGVEQVVVEIDLRQFGGSAQTADIDVPKDRQRIFDPIPQRDGVVVIAEHFADEKPQSRIVVNDCHARPAMVANVFRAAVPPIVGSVTLR